MPRGGPADRRGEGVSLADSIVTFAQVSPELVPLYYAYGSNMDGAALQSRCPSARFVATARLPLHRFTLMGNGYATIRRDPREDVHGALYDIAAADFAALDAYEDIAGGLYVKTAITVEKSDGSVQRALVYLGCDAATGRSIHPGYVEGIVAAARALELPAAHVASLESFLPGSWTMPDPAS